MDEYNIDPDRVFVAGSSGGATMAAVAGLLYPDVFHGGFCNSHGLPFDLDQPTGWKFWLWGNIWSHQQWADFVAQNQRWVWMEGEHETQVPGQLNPFHVEWLEAGFRTWVHEVPGKGHGKPYESDFEEALRYLDGSSQPILSFQASSGSIASGEPVTLSFDLTALAQRITISGIGDVMGSEVVVWPFETTTYTLTVEGGGESFMQELTVTVDPPPLSGLRIEAGHRTADDSFPLVFKGGRPGKSYQLFRGPRPGYTTWPVGPSFTYQGQPVTIEDPASPVGRSFYIVREIGP
jgi:hypothetical protein